MWPRNNVISLKYIQTDRYIRHEVNRSLGIFELGKVAVLHILYKLSLIELASEFICTQFLDYNSHAQEYRKTIILQSVIYLAI